MRYTDPTGHECENGDDDINGECLNSTEEILSNTDYEDVKETLCGTAAWLICTNLNWQLEPEVEYALGYGYIQSVSDLSGILAAKITGKSQNKKNQSNASGGPPSPNGKRGSKEHQEAVEAIARNIESRNLVPKREFHVKTPGGFKESRFVDVAALDKTTKKPVEFWQVGGVNNSGIPVSRELRAAADILYNSIYRLVINFISKK